jgi:hypothetical protein
LVEEQVPYGLKITFLVHVIVAAIFGLLFLLIPDVFAKLTGFPVQEPGMSVVRVLGAAMLALAASSGFSYRQTLWDRVDIVVQMEIVWTILGAPGRAEKSVNSKQAGRESQKATRLLGSFRISGFASS